MGEARLHFDPPAPAPENCGDTMINVGREGNAMNWFILSVSAAVLWGVGPLFAKAGLVRSGPLVGLSIRTFAAAGVLLAAGLWTGEIGRFKELDGRSIGLLAAEGLIASLAGHFAYFYALKLGQASKVAPITAAFPIVTVALAAVILHEPLTIGKVAGGILIILGVFLVKAF